MGMYVNYRLKAEHHINYIVNKTKYSNILFKKIYDGHS